MKEEFMYFLWKYRLFNHNDLKTTSGLEVRIVNPGTFNKDAGPDFFAAQIFIGNTLWAGNIEMHIRSSDWNRHGHQDDKAYDNIILHVVMHHDHEITDRNQQIVPVLELTSYYDKSLLNNYESILASKSWIPCDGYLSGVNPMIVMNWLNRILVERLENKTTEIIKFFQYFENNWEQTFYYFLARNFGFKINSNPFALLAQKTPYTILARHKNDLIQLEALLFGQAGMLEDDFNDAYPVLLKKEYQFLKHKYSLQNIEKSLWKFGKLRPSNFPTIRIAQFAMLIHRSTGLFSKIIQNHSYEELLKLFSVQSSAYWDNHYVFGKTSSSKPKKLGTNAVENIIINTVVPLKFIYGTERLQLNIRDQALTLLSELPAEQNLTISKWGKSGINPVNAGDSQALLELKKFYCTPKKCLDCAIGHHLVKSADMN